MNHDDIIAALSRLRPGAQFVVRGEEIEWHDETQTEPTTSEIAADIEAHAYVEKRVAEYPPVGDQLDKMFHDFDGWRASIQAIKDKFPKS